VRQAELRKRARGVAEHERGAEPWQDVCLDAKFSLVARDVLKERENGFKWCVFVRNFISYHKNQDG